MKRAAIFLVTAATLLAQASRDSYRVPYQTWRDAAPTLEQDASAPSGEFESRARASREAVERFLAARAAYFGAISAETGSDAEWMSKPLIHAEALLSSRPEVDAMLTRAGEFLSSTDRKSVV